MRKCHAAGVMTLALACCTVAARAQASGGDAAIALERQGKTAEAEDAWKAAARVNPHDPTPFAHLGLLEARQGRYPQAVAFYRKALVIAPAMPGLKLNLGLALFKGNQFKEAIQVFEPMLKVEPAGSEESQRLTILVGMSYYGLGAYKDAVPYLTKGAQIDSSNLPLLLTLAHSCLLSQQFPCVLDAYHRIVALNANSAEAEMLVGEALDQMKDRDGAIREFRAAIQVNPREPNVHFGLGYLLWTQAHTQEAAEEFKAQLENDPAHTQAMLYLADADIQMSKLVEARPLLEKALKDNPASDMGHRDLGIVYAETGNQTGAMSEFKRAIAIRPDDVNAHWRLGRLYQSMGKKPEAQAEFAKARSLNQSASEDLIKVMGRASHADNSTATPNSK